MGYRDTRVVIATRDAAFYNAVQTGFMNTANIESCINVFDLPSAEHKMNRLIFNVIIVDLDTCATTTAYMRQLIEKHKLFIILTAQSPSSAINYTSGSVKEFVLKPRALSEIYITVYLNSILPRIREFTFSAPTMSYHGMQKTVDVNQKIIVIASSTGGTDALEKIFKSMPADIPPILVVQHMPSGFTRFFANRLNSICPMEVREAENNDYLQRGLVLIAPADNHMKLIRRSSKLVVECFSGTKIHGVMPAADILFESVAPLMRSNVIGVILTGMGADGAKGMMLMHLNGATTIGQDKESCVVYGMPKVAFDMGALDMQLPLNKIANTIMSLV